MHRLVANDAAANAYLADLTAAGGGYSGTALVGASPELLVARHGDQVTCRPFAGSAPRLDDPDADEASGAALAASAKNRHEHQLVVDAMREALDPLCVDLQIAQEPQLSKTAAVWHLYTPITGRLREKSTTALDLAIALHPTPAVGGVPATAAAELINELEGDRGFYAGAIGWCDQRGDGRWVVSIRVRAAVGRSPHRRRAFGRRHRRRIRSRRRSRGNHNEIQHDPVGPGSSTMTEIIRPAQPGDETELTAMIHELAEFERASADCTVTENQLREALFGDHPTVYGHIAEVDGQAAAGALWFRNFSTWDGVAGIYLEDLYVRPQFRRRGLARKMLATLARECVNGGYTRLSWAVLDWNVNAIALYDAVGGRPQTEWITYRVSGPELSALAES